MSSDQLIQTINLQNQQIQRLKNIINSNGQVDFQAKYKKALRDISGVIKANRQLKQELDQLKNSRVQAEDSHYQIQKQQFQKAYEKLLQQKNLVTIDNQNLQFQRQKIKYSLNQMEQYVSQLKNQNHILAREKQALQVKIQKLSRDFSKKSGSYNIDQQTKKQIEVLKQKEVQYIRKLEGYQEHHVNLNKLNRQCQQKISELQDKLLKSEQKMLQFEEMKKAQIQLIKINLKKQLTDQITQLKKQNFALKTQNSDLQIRLQSQQIERSNNVKNADYEVQLVDAIKDLQSRMQPMKSQITELKQKSEIDNEQAIRQKAHLKMKNIELQSETQTKDQSIKNLQKRLIKSQQEVRKYKEQQKLIKKLEQQNRILGGRVIVLESKDVALRNRNAQDLQEKIIEFQNRVRILLNDKESLSNIKNVSIHQLIALKAYILELDAKIKSLVQQNEYSNKKYRSYKEKYHNIIKNHKQHDRIINSYKNKLAGYDNLIQKMQRQLERAINMEQIEMNAYGIAQHSVIRTQQQYRRFANSMKEKLDLQQRYKKQELDTLKLSYQTKLMEANFKLEQLKNLQQTVRLYKDKNQDLGNKLMKKQNQILQLKFHKDRLHTAALEEASNAQVYHNRQLVNTLQLRISQKDSAIVKLQLEIRNMQQQWKRRFSQLEMENLRLKELNRKPNSPKMNIHQTTIFEMDQQIRKYRARIAQLQNQIMMISIKKTYRQDDTKERQLSYKITKLQFDLQQANSKIYTLDNQKKKYESKINSLEQEIRQLEGNLLKLRRESKQKIQQHILMLNRKDQQLRNKYLNMNSGSELSFKISQLQGLNHNYALQIEHLKSQLSKSIKASQMLGNKDNQLSIKYDNLSFKYQINNQQKERLQNTVKRLQDRLRDVQNKLRQKQNQLMRVQSQYKHLKIQFQSSYASSTSNTVNKADINNLNLTITNLNQQVFRLNQSHNFLKDQLKRKDNQINDLKDQIDRFKISGDSSKINLSLEIQRLNQQKERLKDQISSLQRNLNQSNQQIKYLNQTINRLNLDLTDSKTKLPSSQYQIYNIESQLRSLTNDNNRYKIDLEKSHTRINQVQKQLIFAKSQINKLNLMKDENQKLRKMLEQNKDTIQTLRNKLINLENSDQKSNVNQYLLREQISKLQIIIRDLRNQQNKAGVNQFDQNYYKNKIKKLETEIIELKNQKNKSIFSSPDRYEQAKKIRELEEEIRNLIIDLERSQININSYTVQINQLKIEIDQKEQQILSLNRDKSIQSNNFRFEIDNLRNDNERMHRIIIERDNQIHSLRLQIQSMKSIDIQTQIIRLQAQIDTLKKDIQNRITIINQKDTLIRQKQTLIINLNNRIQAFKSDHELIQKLDIHIKKTEQQFQQLKIQSQQKQSQLIRLNNYLSQAEAYIQQQRINFENCQRDLLLIREEYEKYKEKIENSENGLQSQKANLLKAVQEIQGFLFERDKIIQERNRQIELLRVQINRLNIQINSRSPTKPLGQTEKSQVQELRFIIQKLQEDLSKQQGTDLEFRQQISKKDLIIDQLNKKYLKIKALLTEKQQLIILLRNDIQNLNSQITTLNKKIDQLNRHINILQNQQMSQQQEKFNNQQRYNLIIVQLNQRNQSIRNLQTQIERLNLTINSLNGQIKDKEDIINMLSQQLRRVKITTTTQQIIPSEDSQNPLAIQIAKLVKQLNKLQIIIAENQRIIQIKDNLLKEQSRSYQQQKFSFEKQILKLRTDIQILIQNQSYDQSNDKGNIESSRMFEIRKGLRAYQQQIQRLNKIIQQLDQDSKFLRLKLTQMANQQDRIAQNLRVMVLSFAEIQALRDRLQSKQNEITDVRNSLIAISRRQAQVFKIESRFIQDPQVKQTEIKRSNVIQRVQGSYYNAINFNNLTSPEQIEKRVKQRSKSMSRLEQLKSTIFSNPNRSIAESKSTYIRQGTQFKAGYQYAHPEIYQPSHVQSKVQQYKRPIEAHFNFQKPINNNLSNTQYSSSQKSGNVVFSTGGNQVSFNTGFINQPSSIEMQRPGGNYQMNQMNYQFQYNQRRI